MPPHSTFTADDLGGDADSVELFLNGTDLVTALSYEVKCGILTQPCAFSIRLGSGDLAKDLLALAPPRTPFELRIGGASQFSGLTDDIEVQGDASSGTSVTIRGRDRMEALLTSAKADRTFQDKTYKDLTVSVLLEVLDAVVLSEGNGANRLINAAATGGAAAKAKDDEDLGAKTAINSTAKRVQIKAGQPWLGFLQREHERAGLFLWAAADGSFVLSTPNGTQAPLYRFTRRRAQSRTETNVLSYRYSNSTAHRFSYCEVLGRGGGADEGTKRARHRFDDDEMLTLGLDRPLVISDPHCDTAERAEFLARRRIAETRRAGWHLEYTIAGHTAPSLDGGRLVIVRDTVARVIDEELGLDTLLYIEDVTYRRGPQTTTTVTMMRPQDLVFGTED